MGIILAVLVFGTIVFVHELGHFLLAKANGIRVDEFSIGMGPRLLSKVKGETRYSLKLFPIGGSCMMGEDDVEDMSEGSFNSKSVWARMAVVAAGAVFNFILAFIFAVIIVGYAGYDEPIISGTLEGYSAEAEGMQAGDRIVRMNGKKINLWREVTYYNMFHQGETVDLVYERDGEKHEVTIIPKQDEDGNYLLGVLSPGKYTKANVLTAMQYGVYEVKFWISTTIESLKMLVTGAVGVDQLSGPVGIVDVVDETYQQSKSYGFLVVLMQMLNIGILLSANLGVMNLLPLPALDGGRLVFMIIEAIRGKRVPPDKEGMVHFVGMILLFALMIFVFFNDIKRIF
ncbi:MAG: RIP metalloprotease RseP [Tyzzerella sp.]|nr:RIP metalloprotease RseP [Tyzzerella sp.]